MDIISTYSCKILHYSHIFAKTVQIYREVVDFLIPVCLEKWDEISSTGTAKEKQRLVEGYVHATKKNPSVLYPDFDTKFYKLPSYLRRSAITETIGKAASYKSNLVNWENSDPSIRGHMPSFPKAGYIYPCMYRSNMYEKTGEYTAKVKVFIRNTWDWLDIRLKKSDVDYIARHCVPFKREKDDLSLLKSREICAPTLQKRGKEWFLDFPVKERCKIVETTITEQRILAVDLGINNACTISIMKSDGTIEGREVLSLPGETDSLTHALNRIKKAQQKGNRRMPRLWAAVKGINDHIAVLTAQFIADMAVRYDVDVVVFEHLDRMGKLRGSKKQKLHLWKSQYVQAMVTDKVHRCGMHISHVCAWNTSRLAYDGSGRVLRGKEAEPGSYSVCKFKTGKIYNCDLNASYNIGARYYIREFLKSLPETVRLDTEAKVPECSKRSTCTLSTLISLNAVLSV